MQVKQANARRGERPWAGLLLVGLLTLAPGSALNHRPAAQQIPPVPQPGIGPPEERGIHDPDPARAHIEDQQRRLATDERHKRLLADADHLVDLSIQLKAAVDKSSKNELSLDVVRRAAEIERLAHDLKERMKN
jgi:hypothetical protein